MPLQDGGDDFGEMSPGFGRGKGHLAAQDVGLADETVGAVAQMGNLFPGGRLKTVAGGVFFFADGAAIVVECQQKDDDEDSQGHPEAAKKIDNR